MMYSPRVDRYIANIFDLELRRPLHINDEVAATASLDVLWDEMSDEEQDEVERRFQAPVDAPETLPFVDVSVEIGTRTLPRRSV